jgi:NADH dehydrogenase/NADH:ubiquinone oxidoreductase subunit G
MPRITINGHPVDTQATRLIEAIRGQGIEIPALCHHPALSPAGACKLCAVEVARPDKASKIGLSCCLRVREGMEVRTDTERVYQARVKAFNDLIRYAPESRTIRDLARDFGIELDPAPDECIRCRLCVRVCREVVGASALSVEKRDGVSYVVPHPENPCLGGATCVNICPTGAIKMEDSGDLRTIWIRDETIGQVSLQRCEACGNLFATERFLEDVHSKTAPHPDTKERHRYCPTCARMLSYRVRSAG